MMSVVEKTIEQWTEDVRMDPTTCEELDARIIVDALRDDELIPEEIYEIFNNEEKTHGTIYCSYKDRVFNINHIDCSVFHAGNKPSTPVEAMYTYLFQVVNHLFELMRKTLTPKEERMKEREGDRLYRSLRRLFAKPFGFEWTEQETSFYDGKNIFVKYDMQEGRHRPFTDTELRALRYAHGVHEAGHSEFDYLPAYIEWQKDLSASIKQEYLDNVKYPLPWLQYFGNMGLDGRMERLIILKSPSQQPYLDINNYDWRFGDRYQGVGESRLIDFRHAYAHRVLGMEDMDEWHDEAVELLDSVQPIIEKIRKAPSTGSCLAEITTLIRTVWPTLLTWMDLEKQEPSSNDSFTEYMTKGSWSDSEEEAEANGNSVIEQHDDTPDSGGKDAEERTEERERQKASMLRRLEKGLEKDIEEVEQELAGEAPSEMKVSFQGIANELSSVVKELPIPMPDLHQYKTSLKKIDRFIKPVAKELSTLLEGTPEQPRRNVRSGRFMPSQAWRAVHCDDTNIFSKQIKGNPKEDAFIGLMTDISGSTSNTLDGGEPIYEEMRKALSLLLESSERAGIPTEAYAFSEHQETTIYRLKPTDSPLSDTHRRAIGGIRPYFGNRDTVALKYLLDRIQKRTEGIRLAVMLSDGVPIFEHDEGPETIQRMVKDAEKQGITVLCLFIGNHEGYTVDIVKQMYPGRVIAADNGIAKELQKHVKRIIRQRRN